MDTFSERVKELRMERNLSLRQLSKITDISPSAIHSYEVGKRNPKREVLEAFADVFNVDMDYLLGRTDIKNRVAHELGYTSLFDAYKANSPDEPKLTEGEMKMLEVYRRASDDVKPILLDAIEALENMSVEKLRFVADLISK